MSSIQNLLVTQDNDSDSHELVVLAIQHTAENKVELFFAVEHVVESAVDAGVLVDCELLLVEEGVEVVVLLKKEEVEVVMGVKEVVVGGLEVVEEEVGGGEGWGGMA